MPNKSLENLESALRLEGEVTSEHCHCSISYPHSGDGRTICKHQCVSFISVCCCVDIFIFISVCCVDKFLFISLCCVEIFSSISVCCVDIFIFISVCCVDIFISVCCVDIST